MVVRTGGSDETVKSGRCKRIVNVAAFAVVAVSCAKQPPDSEIPLLEPGLWTFEIETRREGQPVEKRTIRDCVGLRGLYSADRPTQCRRNEAVRSPDGSLTVSLSCEVEPKPRWSLPGEMRGRGPLDLEELGLKVESRSIFTGDLRKGYVRDNTTILEWPPGEIQTTRSVTRGAWQGATCPVDLSPDRIERWLLNSGGTPAIGGSKADRPEWKIDFANAPKMRTGLWTGTVSTRVDGRVAEVSTLRFCVAEYPRAQPPAGAEALPRNLLSLCGGVSDVTAERSSGGFTVHLRCELPSGQLMMADLDVLRPALRVVSRSDFRGDTANRFEVAHDTTVTYASGRTSRIVSVNRLTRIGDCESGTRKTPP